MGIRHRNKKKNVPQVYSKPSNVVEETLRQVFLSTLRILISYYFDFKRKLVQKVQY